MRRKEVELNSDESVSTFNSTPVHLPPLSFRRDSGRSEFENKDDMKSVEDLLKKKVVKCPCVRGEENQTEDRTGTFDRCCCCCVLTSTFTLQEDEGNRG